MFKELLNFDTPCWKSAAGSRIALFLFRAIAVVKALWKHLFGCSKRRPKIFECRIGNYFATLRELSLMEWNGGLCDLTSNISAFIFSPFFPYHFHNLRCAATKTWIIVEICFDRNLSSPSIFPCFIRIRMFQLFIELGCSNASVESNPYLPNRVLKEKSQLVGVMQ